MNSSERAIVLMARALFYAGYESYGAYVVSEHFRAGIRSSHAKMYCVRAYGVKVLRSPELTQEIVDGLKIIFGELEFHSIYRDAFGIYDTH